MGLNWAEHTVEIAAPIETCFAAITDYETFPAWQSAVVDTEVLDWDKEGRGKRVRLFVDAKVRKVDYTLDYSYDEPERIEWDFVEGNGINDADGHYLFEDLGDRTRATYKLGLEVGIPLPGPVARRAHKSTLKASVEDLKREAERRAGGERPTVEREMSAPAGFTATRDSGDSIREAAGDVASSVVNLGMVIGSKTVGRPARRMIELGTDAAGSVTNRAARLLRRGSGD
jgi:uncharacterized protein YndB with AHSA1/START domain